jgi:ribosomal protein S18 acetylase RimI-like enzyme
MKLLIREFIPADYPAALAVYQAAAPAEPHLEARHWDSPRQFQRWIAKRDGQLVAFAEIAQQPDDARQFWVSLYVHPDQQRRGIGAALYAHLLSALEPHAPAALRAHVRADRTAAIRFLSARGFRAEGRAGRADDRIQFVKLWRAPHHEPERPAF